MGNILSWGCKVKPRRVPKMWPISETGRANIIDILYKSKCIEIAWPLYYESRMRPQAAEGRLYGYANTPCQNIESNAPNIYY